MPTYNAFAGFSSSTTRPVTYLGLGRKPLISITGVANVRPAYGQLWPRRGQ